MSFGTSPGLCRVAAIVIAIQMLVAVDTRANGWEHFAVPFEVLIQGLDFEHDATRAQAARSLGYRNRAAAVPALVKRITASEEAYEVRREIYLSLGRLQDVRGQAALEACLEAEEREELRGECISALAMMGGQRSLTLILDRFDRDPTFLVKSRVVDALGSFTDDVAVSHLLALVEGRNRSLRQRAVASLGRIGDERATKPLLALLETSKSSALRRRIVQAFARYGPAAAAPAMEEILSRTQQPQMRRLAALALASIRAGGDPERLVALLDDADPFVQELAVTGLAERGARGAVPALIALAESSARNLAGVGGELTREQAARAGAALRLQTVVIRALSELGPQPAFDVLAGGAGKIEVALTSQAGLVVGEAVYQRRRAALYGLGYTKHRAAAELLAGPLGLEDRDARLRAVAVRSLGVLGFFDAARTLTPSLRDASPEVRWTAAIVLARLGDASAAPALLAALGDKVAEVRRRAAEALGALKHRPAQAALRQMADADPAPRARTGAQFALKLLAGDK